MDISRMAKEHLNSVIRKSVNLSNRQKDKEELTETEILLLLTKCANEYSWTPDACLLERNEYTPVFVYCNVMQGGNRYSVIENICRKKDDDGLSCNPYVFTKEKYAVWQTRDGVQSIPVALTSRAKQIPPYNELSEVEREWICHYGQLIPAPFRLKGKLYYVRSDLMKELDKEKQNGILFRRRTVELLNPFRPQWNDDPDSAKRIGRMTGSALQDEEVKPLQAWMYVGRRTHWEASLSRLKACALHDPTLRYQRTRPDRPIFATSSKRWDNEPYYFFKAWEVNNIK